MGNGTPMMVSSIAGVVCGSVWDEEVTACESKDVSKGTEEVQGSSGAGAAVNPTMTVDVVSNAGLNALNVVLNPGLDVRNWWSQDADSWDTEGSGNAVSNAARDENMYYWYAPVIVGELEVECLIDIPLLIRISTNPCKLSCNLLQCRVFCKSWELFEELKEMLCLGLCLEVEITR